MRVAETLLAGLIWIQIKEGQWLIFKQAAAKEIPRSAPVLVRKSFNSLGASLRRSLQMGLLFQSPPQSRPDLPSLLTAALRQATVLGERPVEGLYLVLSIGLAFMWWPHKQPLAFVRELAWQLPPCA